MVATTKDVCQALRTGRTIDITTIGRRSGRPSRIETWFHNVNGEIYLTGSPGKRDWYANLVHTPAFTFHVKEGVTADLAGQATPITDSVERRAIFEQILPRIGHSNKIEVWMTSSPLMRVALDVDCPDLA